MNREILFRGQNRKNGEKVAIGTSEKLPGHWVYGGIYPGEGDFSIIYGCESAEEQTACNIKKWTVYSDTVGQYTGLTDKNGVKIFEGDIMEFDAYGIHYCGVVTIISANASISCGEKAAPFLDHAIDRYGARIIGNIHDNPELLKEAPHGQTNHP